MPEHLSVFTQFISPQVKFLFGAGVLLNIFASIWFLFASYGCDVRLARWSCFVPFASVKFALVHPERCLAPFILQHVALLLCLPMVLRFSQMWHHLQSRM